MVTVIKKDSIGNITIDGVETTISKQNDKYKNHETSKKFAELTGYFRSRINPATGTYYTTEEYQKEIAKNKSLNPNIWAEIDRGLKDIKGDINDWKCNKTTLWNEASGKRMAEIIEENDKWFQENLPWIEKMVTNMEQLKSQLEATGNEYGNEYNDPNKGKNEEELKRRAREIENHRQQAKNEIENALNQSPAITSEELSANNRNWQEQIWNTIIATGEKEIDAIKSRVLSDITAKRNAKNGEKPKSDDKLAIFKRDAIGEIDDKKNAAGLLNESDLDIVNHGWRQEILEADSENKINLIKARVLADIRNRESKRTQQREQAKASAQKLAQSTKEEIDKMEDKKLQESMNLFTRWEGELTNAETASQIEERLMREHPEVYRDTIINALIQRMGDYGITPKDLDEESQQLLRGDITDVNKFKQIKDKAVKAIGAKGAKSQWDALMSQARELLEKAKNKVTEQVKKDIKTIQSQINNFKAGTNSYLASMYSSNKNTAERMESDLNSCLTNQNTSASKETPWGIIIPVSLVTVAAIAAAVIVIRKKRQAKIVE